MVNRYNTNGNAEADFQPGSDNQVLINKLGITDVEEMEEAEFDALIEFQPGLFDELAMNAQITAQDLCNWHRRWLEGIYEWAGNYRSVNIEKDGFMFAAVHLIPDLMANFERDYLVRYTPCISMNHNELVAAMATCHVEFIIIHPFREGNGRLGRLLTTVMALQADMPVLNFETIERNKEGYIAAIHAGHAGDYEPMTTIFWEVLNYSLQQNDQT